MQTSSKKIYLLSHLDILPVILSLILGLNTAFAQRPAPHNNVRHAELPQEQLSQLNKVVKAASVYEHDKLAHIDSLTAMLRALPPDDCKHRWQLTDSIARQYLNLRADSAMVYAGAALDIARDNALADDEISSRIILVRALSTCGIFTKALEVFNSIDPSTLPRNLYINYLFAGRRMYGYMKTMVEGDKDFYKEYNDKYMQFDDSLVNLLPANSNYRMFLVCEHMVDNRQYDRAKPMLEQILASTTEENNLYGMTAFQLAIVYRMLGDETSYAAWLARAAISDIKGCVNDGLALPMLAYWLYEQGELNDAFKYINFALESASAGNVRIRTVTIGSMLPLIDEAYRQKINASRDELMVYFLLVTFLLIVSGILLTITLRQIKISRAAAGKLARTSKLQENYIGNFISLGSTYANRLLSLQRTVYSKISAGQADELLKIVRSGKFNDDLNTEFCTLFDSAFLDIYPDFIAGINKLLRDDEQIELRDDKSLTPDLRIYAFVRLGIEESTRIAQILNYSVSTVYAYRNRMRNRAIDRDKFDRDVMQIGSVN